MLRLSRSTQYIHQGEGYKCRNYPSKIMLCQGYELNNVCQVLTINDEAKKVGDTEYECYQYHSLENSL